MIRRCTIRGYLLIGQLVWNPPEWLTAWWIVRTASAAVGHVIARVIRSHLIAGDGDLDGDIGAAAPFDQGDERPEFDLAEFRTRQPF